MSDPEAAYYKIVADVLLPAINNALVGPQHPIANIITRLTSTVSTSQSRQLNTAERYFVGNTASMTRGYKSLRELSNYDLINEYGGEAAGADRCCDAWECEDSSNNLELLRTEILRRMAAHSPGH